MARAILVTLGYKVHHILVSRREGQVLSQHGLDVLSRDNLAVTLVEETEALFGFFFFS